MKYLYISFAIFFLASGRSESRGQGSHPANNLIPFATGVNKPVCIANAGDSRLFVVDQTGYIYIIDSLGAVNPKPFLDIHERVTYGGERGMLGLAFHPSYAVNGYFYVNYISNSDSTHICRFSVGGDPDTADPASEFRLMTIYQPYTNHKGGDLNFGPDGYLYIGLGDGGSSGDPGNRAQNPLDYHGKLLRIDVNGGSPYAIPPSNPFYNDPNILGEIWSLGLRNPWRFSFDRLSGDLWIADVGQNLYEEIDYQPAGNPGGENYGWRCYEGNEIYNDSACPPAATFTFPVYTYGHGPECSVTGGYVYRGNSSSPFYGYYFFADYCSDRIWTLHNESGTWVKEDYGQFAGNSFCTFGEGSDGQLYVAGLASGTIYLVAAGPAGTGDAVIPPGARIIQLSFSGRVLVESGRPDASLLHYTLYDIAGNARMEGTTRKSSYELDAGDLPSGAYILKIETGGSTLSRKIIIAK